MKIFTAYSLGELTVQAQCSSRRRQHHIVNESYAASCQFLFNVTIESSSYIRPDRHFVALRNKLLIAVVRGLIALVTFNELGSVTRIVRFGEDRSRKCLPSGAEIPANIWHTVIVLWPGCILLEVKGAI